MRALLQRLEEGAPRKRDVAAIRQRQMKRFDKLRPKAKAAAVKRGGFEWDLRQYGSGGVVMGDEVVVWVNPAKLDKAWQSDRVETSGKGAIGERLGDFEWFLDHADMPIQPPTVEVYQGKIGFENGRHRFTVLKKRGATKIPVAVKKKDAATLKRIAG